MVKKKGVGKATGLLMLLVLVIGLVAGVIGLKNSKLLGSKAAVNKSACTGSWTCTKDTKSYTYLCDRFSGGTKELCTGGADGQGNFCVSSWVRSESCAYSSTGILTPTPIPLPTPETIILTPSVDCKKLIGHGKVKFVYQWQAVTGAKQYEVKLERRTEYGTYNLQKAMYLTPVKITEVPTVPGTYALLVKAWGSYNSETKTTPKSAWGVATCAL